MENETRGSKHSSRARQNPIRVRLTILFLQDWIDKRHSKRLKRRLNVQIWMQFETDWFSVHSTHIFIQMIPQRVLSTHICLIYYIYYKSQCQIRAWLSHLKFDPCNCLHQILHKRLNNKKNIPCCHSAVITFICWIDDHMNTPRIKLLNGRAFWASNWMSFVIQKLWLLVTTCVEY